MLETLIQQIVSTYTNPRLGSQIRAQNEPHNLGSMHVLVLKHFRTYSGQLGPTHRIRRTFVTMLERQLAIEKSFKVT